MTKTLFITGASTGIGKMTAIYFAQKGWNVAATMRDISKGSDLLKYPNIQLFELDVVSKLSVENAVAAAILHFGKIDVLLNNAGVSVVGPFEAMTDEQIENQFNVNIFGVMKVTKAFLPHFRENREGLILNTSSFGGLLAFPLFTSYVSSKWALEGFMESLQYELKPFNISVKTVQPGPLKTGIDHNMPFVTNDDYINYTNIVTKKIKHIFDKSPTAEKVVKKLYQIAENKPTKMRFPIGLDTKMVLALRKVIPLSWFMAIYRREFEKGLKKELNGK